LVWDFWGMLLIGWDVIMIPMQVFEFEQEGIFKAMFWLVQCYWSVDIGMSFFTGVHSSESNTIVMDHSKVARIYVQTWFSFDVLAVLPDWIVIVATGAGSSTGRALKALRLLRAFRTVRLLRLARLMRIARTLEQCLNSESVVVYLSLFKLLLLLAVLLHIVACGWFGISKLDDQDGWANADSIKHRELGYQYLTSLHWALTQFQGSAEIFPENIRERAYAVVVLYVCLVVCASFISRITHLMTLLHNMYAAQDQRKSALLRYLKDNDISPQLSLTTKRYAEKAEKAARQAEKATSVECLHRLPDGVRLALAVEINSAAIPVHRLLNAFVKLEPPLLEGLCRIISKKVHPSGETIFKRGEACRCMYLLKSGTVEYLKVGRNSPSVFTKCADSFTADEDYEMMSSVPLGQQRNTECSNTAFSRFGSVRKLFSKREASCFQNPSDGILKESSSVSEMGLWTKWSHKGACVSTSECTVFTIEPSDFQNVVETGSEMIVAKTMIYAQRYLSWLNRQDKPDDLSRPNAWMWRDTLDLNDL